MTMRSTRTWMGRAAAAGLVAGVACMSGTGTPGPGAVPDAAVAPSFLTSDRCIACHKGVSTSTGLDVSIGFDWRASMMAHSARDPYWQAAVRREVIDHPEAAAVIEDECSRCHMPMANEMARATGGRGEVFANLPVGRSAAPYASLAADGVSCAACHQIEPQGLGTEESYVGGFGIARGAPPHAAYGPLEPDSGGVALMESVTDLRQTQSLHVQTSELCATCHTLFTHAVRADGSQGPEFPEQVPYLEWRESAFADSASCQSCHMPVVEEEVSVTGVLGIARPNVSRHVFTGGNFFMLRMLDRYRSELGVTVLPGELALSAARTEALLRKGTVELAIAEAASSADGLRIVVDVRNLTGHKFPTAYPSRRAWLHVVVRDAAGATLFESGAFRPDGSIAGNDNDLDAGRFEPHHERITSPMQVQIYEGIMGDGAGRPTTGLLEAEAWLKENRLLPDGFEPEGAGARVAVRGAAADDSDFRAGGDRVTYLVDVDGAARPLRVEAELWFQPIAYRWAENLATYDAPETRRFLGYYRAMARGSAIPIAKAAVAVP